MVESLRNVLFGVLLVTLFIVAPRPFEAFIFTEQPDRPTIVVQGINSTRVLLVWNYNLTRNERFRISTFNRISAENVGTRIATRIYENSSFVFARIEFKANYETLLPATLVLLDVKNSGRHIYYFLVTYTDGVRNYNIKSEVTVIVYVPPTIDVSPAKTSIVDAGKKFNPDVQRIW